MRAATFHFGLVVCYGGQVFEHVQDPLSECLDTVPGNKIIGFGGDYLFVEGTYGHSIIARGNIARVLSEIVEDGGMKIKES